MKLEELALMAAKAIDQKTAPGMPEIQSAPHVTIRMPSQKTETPTRRLSGANSPLGTVLQRGWNFDVVTFPAVDVLAWCVAVSGGKIKIEYLEEGKQE